MTHWGHHLLLNGRLCTPATLRSRALIRDFAETLVKRIDMVPYGSPQIVMFGTGNKKGYTLVQLIETSNICAHFVEETNDMYLDVFSCKPFEEATVREVVGFYFNPARVTTQMIARDAELR